MKPIEQHIVELKPLLIELGDRLASLEREHNNRMQWCIRPGVRHNGSVMLAWAIVIDGEEHDFCVMPLGKPDDAMQLLPMIVMTIAEYADSIVDSPTGQPPAGHA